MAENVNPCPWLLLLHQIPPSPPYFRAKILRRLNQIGALPVKNSAYLLPANEETLEDFEWLRREIEQEGGEAWLFRCEIETVAGVPDAGLRQRFREARDADFRAIEEQLLGLRGGDPEGRFRKLKRKFEEVRKIDYFDAEGRKDVEKLMQELEARLEGSQGGAGTRGYHGRTWVTRKGIKVDRIGSAWLIRRFLDPAAVIRFVDPANYAHAEGELRFDMFEGEYTHQGELCTFEVLTRLVGKEDKGLALIGEIVHDIDLKESKYQRVETSGVAALLEGITKRCADDEKRLEEGARLFDALYASAS